MKRLVLIILLGVVMPAYSTGIAKEDGGQLGAFLDFGASARSLGMGRAYTAVADDAGAGYWNPSGLSQLTKKDVVSLYSVMEQNTGYGFFSYAQPALDYGTFGLSLVSLRSGNFDKRAAGTGDSLGSFNLSETALLLSHGFRVNRWWSFGTTLKGVRQEIDTYTGTGYGLDTGAMFHLHPKFQAGLMLDNLVAPQLSLKSTKERYPREVRLGGQYRPWQKLLVALDMSKTEKRSFKPHLGAEYSVNQLLSLRGGFNETDLSAGLGFKLGDWDVDYAFAMNQVGSRQNEFDASHRIGFHVSFGRDVNDEGQSVKWQNKARENLTALQHEMNEKDGLISQQVADLIFETMEIIKQRGFTRAQDLYAARGYIHYYHGEYERSVQSLAEALALDKGNETLAYHLHKARMRMDQVDTDRAIVNTLKQLKDQYNKGDWKGAIASSQKILNIKPDHVEAQSYLEDAEHRLREPIERALKIAKKLFERKDYLEAIKHLHDVRKLDPDNRDVAAYMTRAIAALEKAQLNRAETTKPANRAIHEIPVDSAKSREAYSRGLQLYSQGKLKEAAVAWEEAVKYDHENASARNAHQRVKAELHEEQGFVKP